MYAIVETGGKQYKVSEGDIIFVEKLAVEEGSSLDLDKVLAACGSEGFVVGKPYIAGAKVVCSVVKQGKSKKIHVIRYKSKKNEKKHIGHRQPYTKLQVLSINL